MLYEALLRHRRTRRPNCFAGARKGRPPEGAGGDAGRLGAKSRRTPEPVAPR